MRWGMRCLGDALGNAFEFVLGAAVGSGVGLSAYALFGEGADSRLEVMVGQIDFFERTIECLSYILAHRTP